MVTFCGRAERFMTLLMFYVGYSVRFMDDGVQDNEEYACAGATWLPRGASTGLLLLCRCVSCCCQVDFRTYGVYYVRCWSPAAVYVVNGAQMALLRLHVVVPRLLLPFRVSRGSPCG